MRFKFYNLEENNILRCWYYSEIFSSKSPNNKNCAIKVNYLYPIAHLSNILRRFIYFLRVLIIVYRECICKDIIL